MTTPFDPQGPSTRPWTQPPADTPADSPPPPLSQAAHRRRLAAWMTAGALLAGSVAAGGAFVVGRAATPSTAPGALGSAASATGSGVLPGTPPSGAENGRGSEHFGNPGAVDPEQGDLPGGASDPSASTQKATAAELVGLVRIVSTLGYADGRAAGTGLVLSSDGEVVTNHHVVEGATRIRVRVMSSGRTYTARPVGADADADVAVLRLVGAHGLRTVRTDTSGVTVGESVTAVGDGYGTARYLSESDGTVLARHQAITTHDADGTSTEHLRGLIEVGADVVSGYSGGATYDEDGNVVGMTTAASTGADVVGYAIPVRTVLRVAHDIDDGVRTSSYAYGYPAFLGVGLRANAVVAVYDGTPAASAGISAGDRITAIGSVPVRSAAALRSAVTAHSPGDRVAVTWTDRAGAAHSAKVTLARGPVA